MDYLKVLKLLEQTVGSQQLIESVGKIRVNGRLLPDAALPAPDAGCSFWAVSDHQ